MIRVEMREGKVVIVDGDGNEAGSLDLHQLRKGSLTDNGKVRAAANLPVRRLRFANGSFAAVSDQTVLGERFNEEQRIA